MDNIILSSFSKEELLAGIKVVLDSAIDDAITKSIGQNQHDPNRRLTIKEVCEKYQISKPTLHKHMRCGLPFQKIGRKTVFMLQEVERYFNAQ
ncbi:MAG: helix-turn-helix domain-containing protein [Reichenbachiella sp.]|uniref:helix-turn-helix domain-containing protein n=1 Tax=Reichenbachiella sp. TaxID=2184521 RepID=UPI0032651B3D